MHIIGAGGPRDKQSIDLVTRKRRRIPNEQRMEWLPERMREAARILCTSHPNWTLRSLSATYNCMGMVFACRRTCIEPEHFRLIVTDDGQVEISKITDSFPGDLAAYVDGKDEVVHVGVVLDRSVDVASASVNLRVLSQFGADGEYIHAADDLPEYLAGARLTIWSEANRHDRT